MLMWWWSAVNLSFFRCLACRYALQRQKETLADEEA
jgi:hypothetical protein